MQQTNRKANRLINETSPYLLQHAYNPVDWYPWGEDAFNKAKQEDKPVLLSIGYSTCHWCHVMERESFENEEVAALMNKYFVCIKLDREERPDLDHIYMDALQAMTGQGGWPLNIFLTPDKKPFYGGTYFPPKPIYGRPSWTEVLLMVQQAYATNKENIAKQTEHLLQHLSKMNELAVYNHSFEFNDDYFHKAFHILKQSFDKDNGGYGSAPKFPSTYTTRFLLNYNYFFGDEESLKHALHTVKMMLMGGIYDQIRGGLCRYATDPAWIIPHFEKMLYDNANFLELLCDVYKITKDPEIKYALQQTVKFIRDEFMSDNNLFYSAYDADSDNIEGKYYCWTQDELKEVLGEEMDWFVKYYNIEPDGNWEHTNILFRQYSPKDFAKLLEMSEATFIDKLNTAHQLLIRAAMNRTNPSLDYKHLTSWNAMMIKSFIQTAIVLEQEEYGQIAESVYASLTNKISKPDGTIWHQVTNNTPAHQAVLEDYAAYIDASLSLYAYSGNLSYLSKAESLTEIALRNFYNKEARLFNYSGKEVGDTFINKVEFFDNVIASANSWMISNLIQLNSIHHREDYETIIQDAFKCISDLAGKHPLSFSNWLKTMLVFSKNKGELVVTGSQPIVSLRIIQQLFKPDYLILPLCQEDNTRMLFVNKYSDKNQFIYYLCKNKQCQQPSEDFEKLLNDFRN